MRGNNTDTCNISFPVEKDISYSPCEECYVEIDTSFNCDKPPYTVYDKDNHSLITGNTCSASYSDQRLTGGISFKNSIDIKSNQMFQDFAECYYKFLTLRNEGNKQWSMKRMEKLYSLAVFVHTKLESKSASSLFIPDEILEDYLWGQNIHSQNLFFSFKNIRKFYFRHLFKFLYLQKNIEKKEKIFEILLNLEIENYLTQIASIEKISSDNLNIFSCYKTEAIHCSSSVDSDLFTVDHILKAHSCCLSQIDNKEDSSIILDKYDRSLYKKEIIKLLPDKINVFNYTGKHSENITILKNLRFDTNRKLYSIIIHKKDSVMGLRKSTMGLRSVILNLGPGNLECYVIDDLNVPKLEKMLKDFYKTSINEHGSNFFPDIETLLFHRISLHVTILKPNEIVVISPNCVYSYRSKHEAVCFLYEYAVKDIAQFEIMFEKETNMITSKFTPEFQLNTLLLDYLNKEVCENCPKEIDLDFIKYGYNKLKIIFDEEKQIIRDLKMSNYAHVIILPECNAINPKRCDVCMREIINNSFFCRMCNMRETNSLSFKCLSCLQLHLSEKCSGEIVIYYKYQQAAIDKFMTRIERKINDHGERTAHQISNSFQFELSENYKSFLIEANGKSNPALGSSKNPGYCGMKLAFANEKPPYSTSNEFFQLNFQNENMSMDDSKDYYFLDNASGQYDTCEMNLYLKPSSSDNGSKEESLWNFEL